MIELGKYATTVLSAYGVTLVLLFVLVVLSVRKNAKARARLEALETRKDG